MMLAHAARCPAGPAGVDQASEVIPPDRGRRLSRRRDIGVRGDECAPRMELRDIGRLLHRQRVDRHDMVAFGRIEHRRDQRLCQLLARHDYRPRATVAQDMLMIADGVGGIGRNGNAARRHDAKIGDQPFGPILADQHDSFAGLQSDRLQARCQRRDLPRRFAPAGGTPRAIALGPQERSVAPGLSPREEHAHQIGEVLQLAHVLHCATAAPSLRGSAPPTQRPPTHSIALALNVIGGRVLTEAWPSAFSAGIIASSAVPCST